MKAGRELDVIVHANIFHPEVSFDYKPQEGCAECVADTVNCQVPYCSTDIAAAWQVVEKMRAAGWIFELEYQGGICAVFENDPLWDDAEDIRQTAREDSAPLAICLAALKALNVKVPR